MSDLLTAHEYRAIAETMAIGGNAFIDGIARPASSGETFPTTNPATGHELAQVAACGKADGELTPGNWKNTMAMTKFDIPGAPPEVAARAKAILGQSQTSELCMSAAQAKEYGIIDLVIKHRE